MFNKRIIFLFLFSGFIFNSSSAFSAGDQTAYLKTLQSPGAQWEKKFKSGSEVEFYLKGNKDSVNISARLFKDIPVRAETFLSEVRKEMQGDQRYRGATLTAVQSQSRGGQDWDTFTVVGDLELRQELWARKLDKGTVLIVLYTAVGNYYQDQRSAFQDVLQQASR